jgi:hypothetical protein
MSKAISINIGSSVVFFRFVKMGLKRKKFLRRKRRCKVERSEKEKR